MFFVHFEFFTARDTRSAAPPELCCFSLETRVTIQICVQGCVHLKCQHCANSLLLLLAIFHTKLEKTLFYNNISLLDFPNKTCKLWLPHIS